MTNRDAIPGATTATGTADTAGTPPPHAGVVHVEEQVDVLVVGGGLAGLCTALFLARAGVRATLVERHPATSVLPQARAFNPRSMEIFRSVGLEPAVRARTSRLAEHPEMIGAETLTGQERFRVDLLAQVRPPAGVSSTDWCMVDQDELERVVRAAAEDAGADVRFDVELTALHPDDEGVTTHLRTGGGDQFRLRARYAVAADGHRAAVRQGLGVESDGPGVVFDTRYVLFDADLEGAVGDRRFLLAYLDRPRPGTTLVPAQTPGRWSVGVPFPPGDGPGDLDEAACVDLVRQATGVGDLPVALVPPVPGRPELVAASAVGGWVARRFRYDRVFFVGDAAHVVPPAGSYGANTAIADAHNLAWKLAAVLAGEGSPALLDSYDRERRPVAALTLRAALQLTGQRHTAGADEIDRIDEIGMIFGYSYDPADASTVSDPRTPDARPGRRAPHVWLGRGGGRCSTLDLLGQRFVVLAGPEGAVWADAAAAAAAELDVAIGCHVVGTDLTDPDDHFCAAYGIGRNGAVLVRPDGFVAWRAADLDGRSGPRLSDAVCHALARAAVG